MGELSAKFNKDNEAGLIEAAKRDRRYFKELYNKYFEQIFRFTLSKVANESLSADLTQQTFVKAMINLPKYEYRGIPFGAWLYRIALNEINLHFRNNKKKRTVTLEENSLQSFIEEFDEYFTEEKKAALLSAMQDLSPGALQIIEMRYFEKRSFNEVSQILGITESNAKVRVHRILKKMKEAMLIKLKGTNEPG